VAARLRDIGFEADDIFLDYDAESGMVAGVAWERQLQENLADARVVICLISSSWLKSDWCRAEYHTALLSGLTVFSIVIEECDHGALSASVQKLFLNRDGQAAWMKLERGIEAAGFHPRRRPFQFDPARGPYPGLKSFEEADAAVFFGRELEIDNVLTQLTAMRNDRTRARSLVLLGASGSGKSSVMKAGVMARLRRRVQDWIVLPAMRPGPAPLHALADCLAAGVRQRGGQVDPASLYGAFAAGDLVATWRSVEAQLITAPTHDQDIDRASYRPSILLPIDQLEEALRLAQESERVRFIQALAAGVSCGEFITVATMRSDFLPDYQGDAIAGALSAQFYSLPPVASSQLVDLIRKPAEVAGVDIEEALVRRAAEDAGDGSSVPLLAFALERLWREHISEQPITLEGYVRIGGIRGAIGATMVQARLSVGASEKALADLFVPRLVAVGARGEAVRRQASKSEFEGADARLVESLIERRLLMASAGDDAESALVEVIHERVLSSSEAIAAAVAREKENIATLQVLESEWAELAALTPFESDRRLRAVSGAARERLRTLELLPEWAGRLQAIRPALALHARRYNRAALMFGLWMIAGFAASVLMAIARDVTFLQAVSALFGFTAALIAIWALRVEGLLEGRWRTRLLTLAVITTIVLFAMAGSGARLILARNLFSQTERALDPGQFAHHAITMETRA